MNISLVSIGTTGAGPVYSLEMAKALTETGACNLQVIISSYVTNLKAWDDYFKMHPEVEYRIIETYKHTTKAVLKTIFFDKVKKQQVVDMINGFKADVLYIPFGFMWSDYVYPRLDKNIRIVTTIHDPHPHDSFINGFKWFVFRQLAGNKSANFVSDIIILNKRDVEYVKNKYDKDVTVIPHASFSYYVNNDSTDYTLKNRIGFFGRIEPYKGLDILVDAFTEINDPKLDLLVAGSGAIDRPVLDRINANPKIELLNRYIEDEEFQGLIDKVDFVVLPYKRASQSGIIPMAFAFGKTVIATNVGALEEQVPEDTGMIVPASVESVREAIEMFYANPSLIKEYGKNAKHYADTELTWEHSAKLLLDYISVH